MEWIWDGFSSLILCQVKTFQQNSGNGNGGLGLQIFSSIHHSLELLKIWTKMKEDINNFTFYDLNRKAQILSSSTNIYNENKMQIFNSNVSDAINKQ